MTIADIFCGIAFAGGVTLAVAGAEVIVGSLVGSWIAWNHHVDTLDLTEAQMLSPSPLDADWRVYQQPLVTEESWRG